MDDNPPKFERWTVKCQATADGSGDVIVDLPPELLLKLDLGIGDELTIEVVEGVIVLKPKHSNPDLTDI
ncbi:AbrB/MazE/SpoVT family DNA-binding domain-containing protein [Pseudomonas sp. OV226]|uniref:AbrB/MazE/SpoVT family DNA-binding domain-containing protein n=1 Tax=Pseudomonas sp. OV226 TaxID=2135588 RepID=UPI000D6B7507|nr:AbrB/MazE/SpoVT family DNA-binding domain-containing protein [Pseudomonas sp. OV226]PWK39402.1 antitoxin ChpS [Pseudomonas sp. OV226]